MNGDDFPDANDNKEISLPSNEQKDAWRSEARSLLKQIRNSRICVFPGLPSRQRGRMRSYLDCLKWADAYDTLICFQAKSGKAAIRVRFARLEEHILHNLGHSVGDVTITRAVQERDDLYRDVIQQPIFFPDTRITWHTGEPEPKRKAKKWLHIGQVNYEIRRRRQALRQGQIRVIHIGYSTAFAWPLFMMPHGLRPTMVILNPPFLPPQHQ